ncbi:hypothetical protein DDZ13_15100 [Coraliomargarita sinensis]|uniref:Holin n=1 Tax=Coraliomargarita sinensis TaxID=2174842 RepID=A0A317ZF86_9BACT|nr:hypothetical protein [Coraliomargarita sinensis]PXA02833.1 hypothetical protein DDZ13_15100 [Coraliomargarita sinensis]
MSDVTDSPESKFSESFASDYVQQTKVHLNFDQNVVIITEDRLELCLRDYIGLITKRKGWITPVSLLAAFVTAVCTSDFSETFGISKSTWEAVFIILIFISLVWSACSIIDAIRNRSSLRDLIDAIKKSGKVSKGTNQSES